MPPLQKPVSVNKLITHSALCIIVHKNRQSALSCLFSFLSIAPSQPQALRTDFINATALSVLWEPSLSPNGIILNYTVELQISGSPPFRSRASASTSEEFGGLSPATMYTVTVSGVTKGGIGEVASLSVTTAPCEW